MASIKLEVTKNTASIQKSATLQSAKLTIVKKGTVLTATTSKNGYYYVKVGKYKGYIQKQNVKRYTGSSSKTVDTNAHPETKVVSTKTSNTVSTTSKLLTNNLIGIYGIPYQFMNTVDRRLSGTSVGRKYAEKIVGRMPLLFLTPGKQSFMTEFSKTDKKNVLTKLTDIALNKTNNAMIDDIVTRTGRYYTFDFAYKEYFEYVNPMCNITAKLLGLAGKKITIGSYSATLGTFDWSRILNNSFKSYFSASENIVFYVNSNTSVSESFSNDTRESTLASTVNGVSDAMKEVQFLVGQTSGKQLSALNSENYEATLSSINSIIDNFLNGSGVLKNLSGNFTTVLSGGKLIFPEMWSDSDFSRSYDVDIKLRSPDRDPLSLYLNIIVPYIHLLAMTAPHQLNPNGYSSPFLVRAFYKGLFNVDMGIITNLSVTKGKEMSWSDNGIPTEMDISLTIKDLYSSMFISNNKDIGQMINNTALMDYLSNLVGLNLSKPEVTRQLEVYAMLVGARVGQYPNNVWQKFEQNISNMLQKLYSW